MPLSKSPIVSVVTPVYNGGAFFAECIESVLSQTFGDFEYIIVNNCSKDETLEVALSYAKKDDRIRVHNNKDFVGVIDNHNIAFRLISSQSRYCKVVSGDDWIFPNCLAEMVALADAHPSVGLVGSYQLSGGGEDGRDWSVRWAEIKYPSAVTPGREICRKQLLGGPYVFGTPTSTLYRADLVRKRDKFYPNQSAEADTSSCYQVLQESDFGFVHKILSYERVHQVRMTTTSQKLNAYMSSKLNDLIQYGGFCMSEAELRARREGLLDEYYRDLAIGLVHGRRGDFWKYHKKRMKELGYPLDSIRLSKAVLVKLIDMLLNPKRTVEAITKTR